jgi:hypothetical protein
LVLLSHRTPTISFNVSAFDELAQRDTEIDEDLRKLDAELEALALEPWEEEGEGSGRDGDDPGEGEPDDVD